MTTKRLLTAFAAVLISGTLLAGCTGSPAPTPTITQTATPSPTPTPTAATSDPPANEQDAITAAQATIALLLKTQSEVNAAGGIDPSPYDQIATGKALEIYQANAYRIANGPLANEAGVNVEGQARTEGEITYEPWTAYGQEYEGTSNGLVIVPSCLDISEYRITTADGTPAYRPESDLTAVEFQVIYDAARRQWLVFNQIEVNVGQPC